MSSPSFPPPPSLSPHPHWSHSFFLLQVENHPESFSLITRALFIYFLTGVMAFYLPCFSEAKTLWQPRMKVFVLILPSRQEPKQKTACRFLSC